MMTTQSCKRRWLCVPTWGKPFRAAVGFARRVGLAVNVGSSGRLRFIYYWQMSDDIIWMLMAYPKNDREDLSRDQVRQLKILVEEFLL